MRRRHGIAAGTYVILDVSAVKRSHKRVHHLIEEVARLPGDVLLWLDGKPEDPEIPELAGRLLGPRCRVTSYLPDRCRNCMRWADVFAHAALEESFGLVWSRRRPPPGRPLPTTHRISRGCSGPG